jgi:hypothetical protein
MAAKGWGVNALQHPASVLFTVTLNFVPHVQDFLGDLRQAVEQVQKEPPSKKKGTAQIYGSVQAVPEGPIEHLLNIFTDMSLEP